MSDVWVRVAKEFDVIKVKVSKEGEKRLAILQQEGKCLGCERELEQGERITCGMCATCYNAALKAFKKKKVTRTQLIREGKMLPATDGGRRPVNKFTQELSGR